MKCYFSSVLYQGNVASECLLYSWLQNKQGNITENAWDDGIIKASSVWWTVEVFYILHQIVNVVGWLLGIWERSWFTFIVKAFQELIPIPNKTSVKSHHWLPFIMNGLFGGG